MLSLLRSRCSHHHHILLGTCTSCMGQLLSVDHYRRLVDKALAIGTCFWEKTPVHFDQPVQAHMGNCIPSSMFHNILDFSTFEQRTSISRTPSTHNLVHRRPRLWWLWLSSSAVLSVLAVSHLHFCWRLPHHWTVHHLTLQLCALSICPKRPRAPTDPIHGMPKDSASLAGLHPISTIATLSIWASS